MTKERELLHQCAVSYRSCGLTSVPILEIENLLLSSEPTAEQEVMMLQQAMNIVRNAGYVLVTTTIQDNQVVFNTVLDINVVPDETPEEIVDTCLKHVESLSENYRKIFYDRLAEWEYGNAEDTMRSLVEAISLWNDAYTDFEKGIITEHPVKIDNLVKELLVNFEISKK